MAAAAIRPATEAARAPTVRPEAPEVELEAAEAAEAVAEAAASEPEEADADDLVEVLIEDAAEEELLDELETREAMPLEIVEIVVHDEEEGLE